MGIQTGSWHGARLCEPVWLALLVWLVRLVLVAAFRGRHEVQYNPPDRPICLLGRRRCRPVRPHRPRSHSSLVGRNSLLRRRVLVPGNVSRSDFDAPGYLSSHLHVVQPYGVFIRGLAAEEARLHQS